MEGPLKPVYLRYRILKGRSWSQSGQSWSQSWTQSGPSLGPQSGPSLGPQSGPSLRTSIFKVKTQSNGSMNQLISNIPQISLKPASGSWLVSTRYSTLPVYPAWHHPGYTPATARGRSRHGTAVHCSDVGLNMVVGL